MSENIWYKLNQLFFHFEMLEIKKLKDSNSMSFFNLVLSFKFEKEYKEWTHCPNIENIIIIEF